MKIDSNKYKFGSIWDELPANSSLKSNKSKKSKQIPQNVSEAIEFTQAAQKSIDSSVMKTWDAHNDLMKESSELRKIKYQKDFIKQKIEEKYIQNRQEQRELIDDKIQNEKIKHELELKQKYL